MQLSLLLVAVTGVAAQVLAPEAPPDNTRPSSVAGAPSPIAGQPSPVAVRPTPIVARPTPVKATPGTPTSPSATSPSATSPSATKPNATKPGTSKPGAVTPAPACSINVFKKPSFGRVCSEFQSTITYTVYTNCRGCELKTVPLGLGLPCEVTRTIRRDTVAAVTACKTGVPARPTL